MYKNINNKKIIIVIAKTELQSLSKNEEHFPSSPTIF